MALTQEQVYNLGIGDEIIVHGKCEDVYGDGDIRVNTYWTVAGEKREQSFLVHYSYVSLPPEKPKYDPCRLFRKGDIVRLKEWNGRCPALPEDWKCDNGLFKVHEDEKFNSSVEITRENSKTVYIAPICFVELVTPVEELEPYELVETTDYWSVEKENDELCLFWKKHHPHAKEAAEAERDRLNAEYKKENMPI
ncbi:MAG: hypothetical protein II278_04255 [Bacteroidaceae bacterium]|nr:hypothetical protein [Bacteroidaceae bacterium]